MGFACICRLCSTDLGVFRISTVQLRLRCHSERSEESFTTQFYTRLKRR